VEALTDSGKITLLLGFSCVFNCALCIYYKACFYMYYVLVLYDCVIFYEAVVLSTWRDVCMSYIANTGTTLKHSKP